MGIQEFPGPKQDPKELLGELGMVGDCCQNSSSNQEHQKSSDDFTALFMVKMSSKTISSNVFY